MHIDRYFILSDRELTSSHPQPKKNPLLSSFASNLNILLLHVNLCCSDFSFEPVITSLCLVLSYNLSKLFL